MSVGRNDKCPCGSGKKYKQCHEGEQSQQSVSRGVGWTIAAVAVLGVVGIASAFLKDRPAASTQLAAATAPAGAPAGTPGAAANAAAGSAQPAGEVPAGKVWSKEHGHWHDAATGTDKPSPIQVESNSGIAALATSAGTAKPQIPVATPPPGKVWSAEHGHWHDAPGVTKSATAPKPVTGPLSSPNAIRVLGQEISRDQPAGPAPAGKVWSTDHGHWHDKQ